MRARQGSSRQRGPQGGGLPVDAQEVFRANGDAKGFLQVALEAIAGTGRRSLVDTKARDSARVSLADMGAARDTGRFSPGDVGRWRKRHALVHMKAARDAGLDLLRPQPRVLVSPSWAGALRLSKAYKPTPEFQDQWRDPPVETEAGQERQTMAGLEPGLCQGL